MHPYRFVVLSGVGFSAAAMLLPFVSLPASGVIDGLSADAWPALVLTAPVGLVMLDRRSQHGLAGFGGVGATTLAAGGAVFAAVKLADAVAATRSAPGATLGAGAWVLLASTLTVLGGAAYGTLVRR